MEASEYPVSNIPEPLRQRDQWVGWRMIFKDERPTKIPVNVHTGYVASSSDPRTWASFDEALAYFRIIPNSLGLGMCSPKTTRSLASTSMTVSIVKAISFGAKILSCIANLHRGFAVASRGQTVRPRRKTRRVHSAAKTDSVH